MAAYTTNCSGFTEGIGAVVFQGVEAGRDRGTT